MSATASSDGHGPPRPVQLTVEFRNMQQWQEFRRQITGLEGVEDFDVAALSARTADVLLSYPGGEDALAGALAARGAEVRKIATGTLLVRP